MFSFFFLPSFFFLKNIDSIKLQQFSIYDNFYGNFSRNKFKKLNNILGFNFQFFFFLLQNHGFSLKSFKLHYFYFSAKFFKTLFLNRKTLFFLFLLRNKFFRYTIYYRFFFFKSLLKTTCLKSILSQHGLPLRGQRTKTNAVTTHHRFYTKIIEKFFSISKKSYFLF